MPDKVKWVYIINNDEAPKEKGLYAILYSWKPHEGIFDGCISFDGVTLPNLPIAAISSRPFTSITEANKWAEKNNPDW